MLSYGSGLPILAPTSGNNLSTLLFRSTYFNRVPGVPLYVTDLNCRCIDPNKQLTLNPAAWSNPDRWPMGHCRTLLQRLPVSTAPRRVGKGFGRVFQFPGEHEAHPRNELPEHLQSDSDGESDRHESLWRPRHVQAEAAHGLRKMRPQPARSPAGLDFINPGSLFAPARQGTLEMRFQF